MRLALLTFVAAIRAVSCAGESTSPPLPAVPPSAPSDPAPSKGDTAKGAPPPAETPATDVAQGSVTGPTDAQADVRAANALSMNLFRKARKGSPNVMLSGTSLRRALGLAYLGARGETAREMAASLELPDATKTAALAKAEGLAWQEAKGKAELVVADRVWTDKGLALKDDFVKLAEGALGGDPVARVDFARAPDPARKAVNAWVAEKTSNKIVDLLPSGSVDAATRLIVTNAIYFKGRWTSPFSKNATKDETFRAQGGKSVTTPMMHATESHRFGQASGVKLLEMRYDNSDVAMLVALPDDPNGLTKLEDALAPDVFDSWTRALAPQRVAITLPKFTFKSGGSMNAPLQELGMKIPFSNKADFGGIAEPAAGERLQISQVAHQTYVAVDENGTEATAATGIVMHTTSLPMGPIVEFKADRPFLFFIYDAKRGRVLFIGRVADPKAS
ncbi:MAG: serpin family protein [Labilithrix sp.]|nr:serpin family protein [Labilithrix sp.]